MIGILRRFSPFTLFFLLLMLLVLRMHYIIEPPKVNISNAQWGWKWIYSSLETILGNHPRNFVWLSMLNTFLQAIFINRISTQFNLFRTDTFIPAGIFIIITSMIPEWNTLSAPSIAAWFLILLLFGASKFPLSTFPNKLLFNQGLIIGIAALIHYPTIIYLIFSWWSIGIIKRGKLKNFLLPLIGIIIVPYFLLSVQYIFDLKPLSLPYAEILRFNLPQSPIQFTFIVISITFALYIALSIFFLNSLFDKEIIITKNRWMIVMISLIISIIISLFKVGKESAFWYLTLVPSSLMIASIIVTSDNKWIKNISFYLLILLALFLQYHHLFKF